MARKRRRRRKFRPRVLEAGSLLVLGFLWVAAIAASCDRSWDFECTATWGRGDLQISKKVYTYEKLPSETDATARCKQDMLESKPRGAKSATCKCVGK